MRTKVCANLILALLKVSENEIYYFFLKTHEQYNINLLKFQYSLKKYYNTVTLKPRKLAYMDRCRSEL